MLHETLEVLLGLWEMSRSALLVPLGWGLASAAVVIALGLGLWLVARSQGWLEVASGRAGPRRVVLATWVVCLVPLGGFGGIAYGAQRATLSTIERTRVMEAVAGAVATAIVISAVDEDELESDSPRMSVAALRASWSDAQAAVDGFEQRELEALASSQLDEGLTADATARVAKWGLDVLEERLVGDRAEAIDGILDELESHAAADGTLGTEEATAWLVDEYMMPAVRDFVVGIFRPYYAAAWLLVLVGLGLPFLLTAESRRRAAPRLMGAAADVLAGSHHGGAVRSEAAAPVHRTPW